MLPPQPPATAHYYFSLFSREKANPGAHDTRAGKGVFIKYRRFTPVLTQKAPPGERRPFITFLLPTDRQPPDNRRSFVYYPGPVLENPKRMGYFAIE